MISNVIETLIQWFRLYKGKAFLTLVFALFFFVMIFPYNDLSDLVTSKVAQMTQNQVYVQFENLNLDLIPHPALAMDDVNVDLPQMPTLKTSHLAVAPSLSSLLMLKLGFNLRAEDFLGGLLDLTVKPGGKTEQGSTKQSFNMDFHQVRLEDLQQIFSLPVPLQGQANVSTSVTFDPQMLEQPDGELEVSSKKLEIPASSIPTQMGPMQIPSFLFNQVQLKSRMSGGKLIIEDATLGKETDGFQGRIKGQMDLKMEKYGPSVQPNVGAYEFRIDVTVKKHMEKDLNLLFVLVDRFKTPTSDGSRYQFIARGNGYGPPSFVPVAGSF